MGSHVTANGEQLGVRCLAQGHLSRGIEGGESAGYSLPHQQSLPDLRWKCSVVWNSMEDNRNQQLFGYQHSMEVNICWSPFSSIKCDYYPNCCLSPLTSILWNITEVNRDQQLLIFHSMEVSGDKQPHIVPSNVGNQTVAGPHWHL